MIDISSVERMEYCS